MNIRNPTIVTHRGLAGYAPENTLAAYAAALELGFGMEIDLRLTVDEQIVMVHDATLDRTTNGQGPVAEKSLTEIKRLNAGSWFDSSFQDQRVPTLMETLQLVNERRRLPTLIALDVKTDAPSIEIEIAQQVEHYELLDQVVGIGNMLFSNEFRQRFKAVVPQFPTASAANDADEWHSVLADDSADWIYCRFVPDETLVADARDAGKRIIASGPVVMQHQPENWLRLRHFGVDAILTDYPLECQRCWRNQRDSAS
ncbi:MAG: glycerophosphodiester phosphodiesterase family protein [Candidatus Poribacteria bacterium]|nr:glycerophosphodiester phosphodiesterase family protein [Candidatus Poribacteria bacterium]